MIDISSNMGEVMIDLKDRIASLKNPDEMLMTIALAVLPEMRKRVHEHGQDSDESQIGTYSPSYMSVRNGTAKEKGKGKSKRPKYHRGPDTKVILSLTSQMENDMSVIDTETGYGIGYKNPFNLQKALWNEQRYKKKILTELSAKENDIVITVAESYIDENIK